MSFLNNSVDYCEEFQIKRMLLKKMEQYNQFLQDNINIDTCEYNIIPNNNKKYYLYITVKKNKINLLFYADETCKKYYSNYLLIKNTIDDFFMECELVNLEDSSYLLEGYLYGDANHKEFLMTDILFKGNELVSEYIYNKRYKIMYDIFNNKLNEMKNNTISISFHYNVKEDLVILFLYNFKWKHEIISLEYISSYNKIQKFIIGYTPNYINKSNITLKKDNDLNKKSVSFNIVPKKIIKTKKSELYKVYNIELNNDEGFLYVDSLQTSKQLSNLFLNTSEIVIDCVFNRFFQKWSIVK